MIPRPKRRSESPDADRLLSSAISLMLKHGIRATSHEVAVRESGLNTAAGHGVAGDHDELVRKILADIEATTIERIIVAVSAAAQNAEAKLTAFVDGITEATPSDLNRLAFLALAGAEYGHVPGGVQDRVERIFGHLHRTVDGIIQFGWLRGTFRTDLPPREISTVIVGGLLGALLEGRRRSDEIDRKNLNRAVRMVLLRGFEDRTVLERALITFVATGSHP
ncbi:MAG: hypothetical protein O2905_08015 [Proteobacteria bacterium]|nr:hypothetical protein [Pseudomonadota bacterium]